MIEARSTKHEARSKKYEARSTCRSCNEVLGYSGADTLQALAIAVYNILEAHCRTCTEPDLRVFSKSAQPHIRFTQDWGGMPSMSVRFDEK